LVSGAEPSIEEKHQRINPPHKLPTFTRKTLLWSGAVLICAAITIGGYKLLFAKSNQNSSISEAAYQQFLSQQQYVNFPVYYPASLPAGYTLNPDSISSQGGTYSFALKSPTGTDLVTIEQARPPVLERVTKTKSVSNSIGTAYIANLNGQQAGMAISDKTLVTISGTNAGAEQLTQIIQALKPLK
jgi:hypothetical protein